MIKDAQGQPVSGATADSVALYDQAVRAFNLGYGDALRLFDRAREVSPNFTMAYLAQAWLFVLANDPVMLDHARTLLQTVGNLTMNEREQAHRAALGQAVKGARSAAALVLDRHLMRYPFDLVAATLDASGGCGTGQPTATLPDVQAAADPAVVSISVSPSMTSQPWEAA